MKQASWPDISKQQSCTNQQASCMYIWVHVVASCIQIDDTYAVSIPGLDISHCPIALGK